MKVPAIRIASNPINFKAHYYDVLTSQRNAVMIKTDNNPKLGEEPILMTSDAQDDMFEMDNFYVSLLDSAESLGKIKYSIFYKDTGKFDNKNGKGYELNTTKLCHRAIIHDKRYHNQPLVNIIGQGETAGRVVVSNDWNVINETAKNSKTPLIVVADHLHNQDPQNLHPAVKAVILTDMPLSSLSHKGASLRYKTSASAIVYDENIADSLRNKNGKFFKLKAERKGLSFAEIDESEAERIKNIKMHIEIPDIKPINKLLDTSEYTKEYVGPKAYNMSILEKMVKEGTLKDVIIPKSFAIPDKYLFNLYGEHSRWKENCKDKFFELIHSRKFDSAALSKLRDYMMLYDEPKDSPYYNQILDFIKQKGMSEDLMVRSAFNGEDVKNYSAAGLYDSKRNFSKRQLCNNISQVVSSKWSESAYHSRVANDILHEIIKPTVIIQDYVDADYSFTIYTQNGSDEVHIEMRSKEGKNCNNNDPYVLKYDRKEGFLRLESIERKGRRITLDENFKVVDEDPVNDDISDNYEKYAPLLKKVAQNALAVEKEFGAPQDIEGGLKDGKIYFWQTRDIVK